MWQGWEMMQGYGMIFGPIMMIVMLAAFVAVVVLFVRWLGGGSLGPTSIRQPPNTALDVLKERFARGEIDKDEFDERRRVLSD